MLYAGRTFSADALRGLRQPFHKTQYNSETVTLSTPSPWRPDSGFTSLQCCSAWALIWYAAADSVYWEQLPDNLYGFPLYPKPLGPLRSQLLEINTFSERVCKLWFLKNNWGRFLWYRMQNNALYFNLNLLISSQIQSNIKLVWIFR